MSKTTLSMRDFAILYKMVIDEISVKENNGYYYPWNSTGEERESIRKDHLERLKRDTEYQDLLRIRDKLGELNIEIDMPDVEIKE